MQPEGTFYVGSHPYRGYRKTSHSGWAWGVRSRDSWKCSQLEPDGAKTEMYKEFFGLTEDPFNLTPDPKFLYLSQNHGEGLAHLQYGIARKSSPIILTGEMGTGKTTLLYSLVERLDQKTKIVFLVHSQLNFTEILQHILHNF